MLSTYPEKQYAVRCIKLGAAGYLNKSADPDDMVAAVRKVAAGGLLCDARHGRAAGQRRGAGAARQNRAGGAVAPRAPGVPPAHFAGHSVSEIGAQLAGAQYGQHLPRPHPGKNRHQERRGAGAVCERHAKTVIGHKRLICRAGPTPLRRRAANAVHGWCRRPELARLAMHQHLSTRCTRCTMSHRPESRPLRRRPPPDAALRLAARTTRPRTTPPRTPPASQAEAEDMANEPSKPAWSRRCSRRTAVRRALPARRGQAPRGGHCQRAAGWARCRPWPRTRAPLEKKDLKIGFIPITCATPLIMADPLGFYRSRA
jgi:hypothetical protein